MTIKAKVGDESEEITLPALQGFELQRELRYSASPTSYGHACNDCHDTHPICVVLDNADEAVVIPGTSKFIDIVHQETGIRTTVDPVPSYSPKQACLQGAQTVGAKGANASVCGYAIVEVIAKAPLQATTFEGFGDGGDSGMIGHRLALRSAPNLTLSLSL
jgi:hypothetical protein